MNPRGVANSLRLKTDPLHASLLKVEEAKSSSLFSSIPKSKTNQFSVELKFYKLAAIWLIFPFGPPHELNEAGTFHLEKQTFPRLITSASAHSSTCT